MKDITKTQTEKETPIEYRAIESAALVLDFSQEQWEDFAWMMEENILRSAIEGMEKRGIANIQLRCKDWATAKKAAGALVIKESPRISCFVPLESFSDDNAGQNPQEGQGKIALALQLDEAVNDDQGIETAVNRANTVIQEHRRQLLGASLVLPVNRHNHENCAQIAEALNKATGMSVIFDLKMNPLNKENRPLELSWQESDVVYRKVIDLLRAAERRDAFLMNLGMLPTRLLTEHPCNGYVCSGTTCHSEKGNLPRRLILMADGSIHPENRNVAKTMTIGNIKTGKNVGQLVTDYNCSPEHEVFLEYAKRIFVQWVQPCPFRIIPWANLLVELSNDGTEK